jgi:hypothetical protein
LPSSVGLDDTCFPAELVDVSKSGARFRFPECEARLAIAPGQEIYPTVWLPSGKLTRFRAATRWFHQGFGGYIMGVKFLDTADPEMAGELQKLSVLAA